MWRSARGRGSAVGVGCAGGGVRGLTLVVVVVGGGRWIWGRRSLLWRRTRRGCRVADHGVVVAAVPWARHRSRFTTPFEDQVCWLAVHTSKTAVALLMRVSWRSVGGICDRVATERRGGVDLLAGLRRIGIDEVSHRKGHRYLTVVVDHDTGRLVWVAREPRTHDVVRSFLEQLGAERCEQIELVSADMALWISGPIGECCPNASLCVDPFHVIQIATHALDLVRREVWNQARRDGD